MRVLLFISFCWECFRMAFHDNSLWILSHIHNSFVSSDDTGICELVLSPETFKEDMTVIAKDHVGKKFAKK